MRCYECGIRCEWADDMEGIKESEILCNKCYDALEIKLDAITKRAKSEARS